MKSRKIKYELEYNCFAEQPIGQKDEPAGCSIWEKAIGEQ